MMHQNDLGALVITRSHDVRYLTGLGQENDTNPVCCIILRDESPRLVVSDSHSTMYLHGALSSSMETYPMGISNEWCPNDYPIFWDTVANVLSESGVADSIIGLQQDHVSVNEFSYLRRRLPDAGFADISDVLWRARQIKDPGEIEAIRAAVRIAEIGVRTGMEIVVPGKPLADAAVEIEAAMRNAGGQLHGVRAALMSSRRASIPCDRVESGRVQNCDLIIIDVTVSSNGYFAEVSRTVSTDHPDKTQRRLFRAVLTAVETLENTISPGIPIADAARRAHRSLKKLCPNDSLVGSMGCSIGLDVREPPQISMSGRGVFREGMVFSVHPTCQFGPSACAKIGDILLVTNNGCESLSHLLRETM